MHPKHTLRVLFTHNDWARDKLMKLASPLSDEQLDRPFEMGPGSLRGTLRHLYGAERYWFERWIGKDCPEFPPSGEIAAMNDLWDAFRNLAKSRDSFLDGADEDDLRRRVPHSFEGRSHQTPLGDLLLHVSNHGVHHRAQALNMLRHDGVAAPPLDYVEWFHESQ